MSEKVVFTNEQKLKAQHPVSQAKQSFITSSLIRFGFAKNEKEASLILLFIFIGVVFLIAGILFSNTAHRGGLSPAELEREIKAMNTPS